MYKITYKKPNGEYRVKGFDYEGAIEALEKLRKTTSSEVKYYWIYPEIRRDIDRPTKSTTKRKRS